MKIALSILILMNTSSVAQSGKATTTKKTFSRTTSISINIKSDPAIVWTLLTNASDFPRWNSTIVSLEGNIKSGEIIRLKSTLDEKRIFTLKIKEFESEKRLAWGDGKGKRVFILTSNADGTIKFSMTEKIGGVMFPLYAKMIPPFDQSFEQFAKDLKDESETIMKADRS